MLTKIKVFAYIQWKFTKTSPIFFSNGKGGQGARRAGPGSAFDMCFLYMLQDLKKNYKTRISFLLINIPFTNTFNVFPCTPGWISIGNVFSWYLKKKGTFNLEQLSHCINVHRLHLDTLYEGTPSVHVILPEINKWN